MNRETTYLAKFYCIGRRGPRIEERLRRGSLCGDGRLRGCTPGLSASMNWARSNIRELGVELEGKARASADALSSLGRHDIPQDNQQCSDGEDQTQRSNP
jgi:hypothetical protein